MIKKSLARAYARALIKSAKDDEELRGYLQDLKDVGSILRTSRELYESLMKPVLPNTKRLELFKRIIVKLEVNKTVENLLGVLLQNYRLGYIDTITQLIEEEIDRKAGIVRGEFITADMVESSLISRVQEKLSNLIGKKVILSHRTQKDIIGGAIIKVGSLEIDGSILRRINSIDSINVF